MKHSKFNIPFNSKISGKLYIIFHKLSDNINFEVEILITNDINIGINEIIHSYVDDIDKFYKKIIFTQDDIEKLSNSFGLKLK